MAKKLKLNSLGNKKEDKQPEAKSSTAQARSKSKAELEKSMMDQMSAKSAKLAGSSAKSTDSSFLGGNKFSSGNYKFGQFEAKSASAGAQETPDDASSLISKPIRFSDRNKVMNNNDGSMMKILMFIVVVVAVGMGLIYFVMNFGQDNANQNNTNTSTAETIQPLLRPGVEVYNEILPDVAGDDTAPIEFYSDTELSLGAGVAEGTVSLEKITYQPYAAFTRVRLGFVGTEENLPPIEISTEDDQVFLTIQDVEVTNPEMLELIVPQAGAFVSIEGEQTDAVVNFMLTGIEPVYYYASIGEGLEQLVIDFKTATQMDEDQISSSETSTATTSSTTQTTTTTSSVQSTTTSSQSTSSAASSSTSTVVGDQKLTNQQSQQRQTIVNPNVNPDGVIMERYYYQDFGPKFELNFEFKGSGVSSAPNVEAEIISNNNTSYIEVVFSNVQFDYFYGNGISESTFPGVDTTYANLKKVMFRERNGDNYTYWLELGAPGDYRLTANQVSEGGRRQVKFEVFD